MKKSIALTILAASGLLLASTSAVSAEPTVQTFIRAKASQPGSNRDIDLTYVIKTDADGKPSLEILEYYKMDTCGRGVIKGEFIEDELAKIIKFTPAISYCPVFGIGFDKEMTKGWHLTAKDGKLPTGARLFQWAKDGNFAPSFLLK